ncbi:MAG: EamA family transporter [Prevotella sp.]|nr:EamA family transporter [Prevotella sp.]
MQHAFLYLHLGILLAGFTGLFGRLITMHEVDIVWYRMLFASLFILPFTGLPKIGCKRIFNIAMCGGLLGLHWILFYGSIKVSNVSIGVVCYALVGFFTALIEPLFFHRRISRTEIFYSLITVAGLLCIFSLDPRYRFGIMLGTISSAIAALYSVYNKQVTIGVDSKTVLIYQILGGLGVVTLLIPIYLGIFPPSQPVFVLPAGSNLYWLLCLAFFCTSILYLFQIMALKALSAFTVNLSYNLEPIYTIILAFIFFSEGRELNASFYIGISLIILSVALQTIRSIRNKNLKQD